MRGVFLFCFEGKQFFQQKNFTDFFKKRHFFHPDWVAHLVGASSLSARVAVSGHVHRSGRSIKGIFRFNFLLIKPSFNKESLTSVGTWPSATQESQPRRKAPVQRFLSQATLCPRGPGPHARRPEHHGEGRLLDTHLHTFPRCARCLLSARKARPLPGRRSYKRLWRREAGRMSVKLERPVLPFLKYTYFFY